jgi:hypothetical protein
MHNRRIGKSTTVTKSLKRNKNNRRSKEQKDGVVDLFDVNKKLDIEKDKCALCKQGHEFGILLKKTLSPYYTNDKDKEDDNSGSEEGMEDDTPLGKAKDPENLSSSDPPTNYMKDYNGVWVSRYGLTKLGSSQRGMVHYYCAMSSPGVWYTGKEWINVGVEVKRGQQLKCSECGVNGATIGCQVPRCGYKVHLPCGLKNGLQYNVIYRSRVLVCQKHRDEELRKDLEKDATINALHDISNGKETVPVQYDTAQESLTGEFRYHFLFHFLYVFVYLVCYCYFVAL